tara:strand:+ start:89 stop:367 length:279 start_codon:yes stop_codon:yes gene_type:complete
MTSMARSLLLLSAMAALSRAEENVCLFYDTMQGSTESVAEYIGAKTGLQPIPIGLILTHPSGPDLFKSCGARQLRMGTARWIGAPSIHFQLI